MDNPEQVPDATYLPSEPTENGLRTEPVWERDLAPHGYVHCYPGAYQWRYFAALLVDGIEIDSDISPHQYPGPCEAMVAGQMAHDNLKRKKKR
jgi:hypothetical protein